MTVAQGTPRTDEEVEIAKKYPATAHGLWVSAEFTRELERENAALSAQVVELQKEVEGWKRYKANIDEALNTGDGSYRP